MTVHQGGEEAFGQEKRFFKNKITVKRIDHSWSGRTRSAARDVRHYTREVTDSHLEFYQRDVINGTRSQCNFDFHLRFQHSRPDHQSTSQDERVNTLREEPNVQPEFYLRDVTDGMRSLLNLTLRRKHYLQLSFPTWFSLHASLVQRYCASGH